MHAIEAWQYEQIPREQGFISCLGETYRGRGPLLSIRISRRDGD